jgi:hypothetical protein
MNNVQDVQVSDTTEDDKVSKADKQKLINSFNERPIMEA